MMGQPIAAQFVKAGFEVTGYVRRVEAREKCREFGVSLVDSVAEAATDRDIFGVVVVDDAQVMDVVAGEAGAIHSMKPGSTLIVFSTIGPKTAQALERICDGVDVSVVDAAVSGGAARAEEGSLSVIAGGSDDAIARCRPLFDTIASSVFHVGPCGAGAAAKLANNLMANANQLIALEACRLAAAYGINESRLMEIASKSSGDSWVVQVWGYYDRILREHPWSDTPQMYYYLSKDLLGAVAAAHDRGESLPLTAIAAELAPTMYRQRYSELSNDVVVDVDSTAALSDGS